MPTEQPAGNSVFTTSHEYVLREARYVLSERFGVNDERRRDDHRHGATLVNFSTCSAQWPQYANSWQKAGIFGTSAPRSNYLDA